jgi:hypothetical protein
LTRSRGAWRASRLQRSSVASSGHQDKIITAGGWRNGIASEILGGFRRFFYGAKLVKICITQGFIAMPTVEKHIGIGALCDGASALAKLGFVKAC